MYRLFLFLIMNIISLATFASSSNYILTNETVSSDLTPYIRMYKDSSENTPFSVISDPLNEGRFKVVTTKNLIFSPLAGAYWLYFELGNQSGNRDWFVDIDNPSLSNVAFYVVNQAGITDTVIYGGFDSLQENKFRDYTSSPFRLSIPPGSTKKLFLRVNCDTYINMAVRVMTLESFVRKSNLNQGFLAFFWGIIMTALIISIVIYIRARHENYLMNLVLLISFALLMFYQFGFGIDPFPYLSHDLKQRIPLSLLGIIYLSFNIRIIQILSLADDRFWRLIFRSISILLLAHILLPLFTFIPVYFISYLTPFIRVFLILFWFCMSIPGVLKYDKGISLFFFSMLPFVFITFTSILILFNIVHYNFILSYLPIFAYALFCAVLTLGSIEELAKLRKEKEKAVELVSINQLLKHEIYMREQAQKTLVDSEEKYRNLIENLNEIIFKIDSENNLVFVSPSVYNQFGYTPEELLGKPFSDYIREGDQKINENFEVLKEKHLRSYEYGLITKSGELRHILTSIKAIFENGEFSGGIGTIMDITDRKLTELKLIESEKHLRDLNATKDKFFSIVSHDLLDPFNALLGFSSMLMESAKNEDKALNLRYADIINQSAKRILDLLQNLLIWTKVQSGKLVPNRMIISVSELVSDSLALILLHAQNKKIAIQLEIEENVKAAMDYNMMATVIRNLVGNAIKYSNVGGTILIESNIRDNTLYFSVTDHGTGIDEEHLKQLFMIDKSHGKKGTSEEAGTGLGLFISKEFIEIHGGQISAESTADKGSRFMFSIPAGLA